LSLLVAALALWCLFVSLLGNCNCATAFSWSSIPHPFGIARRMFRSVPKTLSTIRVVSYNVLSPNLATPASYPTLNPDHLDPSKRLEVVLEKIEQEILGQQREQRVIVCLQEVSYDWAGSLHTFFANRGYHMVTGLYGRPFNGYMGVALAWPTASFETINVDISRLSDKRPWPKEDPIDEDQEAAESPLKPCFNLLSWLLPKKKKDSDENPPIDPWEYSQRRFNVLLTATLKEKETGNTFCIANYHMPCAFYAPQVMTIHCDLAACRIQELAQQFATATLNNNEDTTAEGETKTTTTTRLPFILAGDWNIKPQDPAYQLLTTGHLSPDDPAYPEPAMSKINPQQTLMTWETTFQQPMRSAYAVMHGHEPDFTNYAAPRSTFEEDECFIDVLDYIFLSPEWKVVEAPEIPHRDTVQGPFPNLDVREASDHVVLSATLELDSTR
jgi:2',5'-phosphodiesterase